MPSYSRRTKQVYRGHRRNRDDISDIEEDSTTMNPTQDEVEEDEEPVTAARSSKQPKKEKGNVRATKVEQRRQQQPQQRQENVEENEVGSEEGDEDEDEIINVENLEDQPLKREQFSKLQGLADDWTKISRMILQSGSQFGDTAASLADFKDDEDSKEKVEEIEDQLREILDLHAIMGLHAEALQNIRQKGLQGEPIVGVVDSYIKNAKSSTSSYKKKTTRQKYAKHDEYITFKTGLWEAQNPGNPMPPITDFIPREPGDISDDDDELEVGGVTQTYLCPITLTLLEEPYTSSVCGHSFSGGAIRATFRVPSAVHKCPAAGCTKTFRLADCKPDKTLEKKVKAHKRRLERSQEDEHSDAEEVLDD